MAHSVFFFSVSSCIYDSYSLHVSSTSFFILSWFGSTSSNKADILRFIWLLIRFFAWSGLTFL